MNKEEMKKLTDDTLEAYKEILTPEVFRLLKIMVSKEEKRTDWVSPGYISFILRVIADKKYYKKIEKKKNKL